MKKELHLCEDNENSERIKTEISDWNKINGKEKGIKKHSVHIV